MTNDLRQRRKEDHSLNTSKNEIHTGAGSNYKVYGKYLMKYILFIVACYIITTVAYQLRFYIFRDNIADEKYYSYEIRHLFRKYDRNYDDYLSIDEFEPIAMQLVNKKNPTDYIQPILNSDQMITINAFIEPLNFSTMMKDMRHAYLTNLDELQSLKLWKQPYLAHLNFAAHHFKSFLPKNARFGEPYWIVEANKNQFIEHLSANRYYPPDVADEHITLHRLLTMFHPRPFIRSRFPPQGSLAVIRAQHGSFLDIYFRIHAEFQLNTPPYHPFWYTPAQFQGRLIMRDDASEVTFFRMYLPNEKRLNIDMEWLVNHGDKSASMEVDIGYMSRMELRSAAPSIKLNETSITSESVISTMDDNLYDNLLKSFQWINDDGKTEKDMYDLLEKKFYPFKEVPYYEYRQAFRKAEETNKLIHTIILWVLESSAVLQLLREHFVSTWTLVVDLKAIISNQSNEDAQRAKYALDNYSFPVESMVQKLDGTVISKINANDLLNIESTSDQFLNTVSDGEHFSIKRYVHFLEQGLHQKDTIN